jgi:glycosyltransferase involved in cell wall biosynthesis
MVRQETPVFEVLESSTYFTPGDQRAARNASGVYGEPCFLWVGRLDANKDPLTVLGAFSIARRDLRDAHLWMCYTAAPLLPRLQRWLEADADLASRVHLMGSVPHPQIEVLCRAADFFVLGSHAEGSGYALLEALACGATPLVTDIPSFRRITGRGHVGALTAPGDAEAMARAMVTLVRANRTALRRATRAHFDHALSFSVVASELRVAFEALIGAR